MVQKRDDGNADAPRVLVPYVGPDPSDDLLDIFVYLRPETNGIAVESTILGEIKNSPFPEAVLKLIYMANVPGEFIVRDHIVEHHYASRLHFAVVGAHGFTDDMLRQFEDHFGVSVEHADIIGAFEALRRFDLSVEELFSVWVPAEDVFRIAGQVVKRYQDTFIVNYDIPALLHKNNTNTDIAVMLFRTNLSYHDFFQLGEQIRLALVNKRLLDPRLPIARAVHITRSRLEQLLDGRDYLLNKDATHVPVDQLSFGRFLMDRGYTRDQILGLADHPICRFDFEGGVPTDHSLYDLCEGYSYLEAEMMLHRVTAQIVPIGSELGATYG